MGDEDANVNMLRCHFESLRSGTRRKEVDKEATKIGLTGFNNVSPRILMLVVCDVMRDDTLRMRADEGLFIFIKHITTFRAASDWLAFSGQLRQISPWFRRLTTNNTLGQIFQHVGGAEARSNRHWCGAFYIRRLSDRTERPKGTIWRTGGPTLRSSLKPDT
jgi:hypothetical protein